MQPQITCQNETLFSLIIYANNPNSPFLNTTGNSVSVFVYGFEPYFYVEAPTATFSPDDCVALAEVLNVSVLKETTLCLFFLPSQIYAIEYLHYTSVFAPNF